MHIDLYIWGRSVLLQCVAFIRHILPGFQFLILGGVPAIVSLFIVFHKAVVTPT